MGAAGTRVVELGDISPVHNPISVEIRINTGYNSKGVDYGYTDAVFAVSMTNYEWTRKV